MVCNREENMNRIHVTRFGFAVGASLAILYVGCVFVMASVPQDAAVRFFNSLLHGLDVRTIMRWDMMVRAPATEGERSPGRAEK